VAEVRARRAAVNFVPAESPCAMIEARGLPHTEVELVLVNG
jgi:hypothetical protein